MKPHLITAIVAVLLMGCGESAHQPSEVKPTEPVSEGAQQDLLTTKVETPDIDIWTAANEGNITAVKQHITSEADVNVNSINGTPLHFATEKGHNAVVELLIAKGGDVNSKDGYGKTPLDKTSDPEITNLLRKHGGKTGEELKTQGN